MVRNICIGGVAHHGIRTMLLRLCNRQFGMLESFGRSPNASQQEIKLAAVSDIRTGGSCIESMQVLRIPGVDPLTASGYAFVAQNFLNTCRRWQHLVAIYNTSAGQRTWPEKIEKYCLRDKGRYDAFTIKEDANVIVASTRISRTRMRNNTSQGLFVHMRGQINTSVICRENRVVCIAN